MLLFLTLHFSHSDRNSELDQQREQYGNLKWKLERRLEELDSELALQRQVGRGVQFLLRCPPCPPSLKPKLYQLEKAILLAVWYPGITDFYFMVICGEV